MKRRAAAQNETSLAEESPITQDQVEAAKPEHDLATIIGPDTPTGGILVDFGGFIGSVVYVG